MDRPTFTDPENAKTLARAALAPRATGHLQSGPAWNRFVSGLKILLPLLTIVAAVSVFVWPFFNSTEVSFTLSRDEVAVSDGKVRLSGLSYVGADASDRAYRVTAASGLQDNPDAPQIRLETIRAELDFSENEMATVTARSGTYDMKGKRLSLAGDVEVLADNGYRVMVAGADIDLQSNVARGQGSVRGRSPLGTLVAGKMELDITGEIVTLTDGVRLHIEPRRDGLVTLDLPPPLVGVSTGAPGSEQTNEENEQ